MVSVGDVASVLKDVRTKIDDELDDVITMRGSPTSFWREHVRKKRLNLSLVNGGDLVNRGLR